jgi:hypothetical protein
MLHILTVVITMLLFMSAHYFHLSLFTVLYTSTDSLSSRHFFLFVIHLGVVWQSNIFYRLDVCEREKEKAKKNPLVYILMSKETTLAT